MVVSPSNTSPSGSGRVITRAANPPPIPPKVLPGSATVTVSLLSGIHALAFTWTLACSPYRSPWTCSQRDRTDSLCVAGRLSVWLTLVPPAPRTSTGTTTRRVVVSGDPMGIVRAASNRWTSSPGHIVSAVLKHNNTQARPLFQGSHVCARLPHRLRGLFSDGPSCFSRAEQRRKIFVLVRLRARNLIRTPAQQSRDSIPAA